MRKRPHEKLVAWKESHDLCLRSYAITKKLPSDERFGLISQMRRSAYSVPTNIAEGNARRTPKDKAHFLDISIASLEELHYQSRLSFNLGYISKLELEDLDDRIQRTGFLVGKLRSSILN